MIELRLIERGRPDLISAVDWQALNLESSVSALEGAGIVRLVRTAAGVLVTPQHYVGQMHAPGVVITVGPKSPPMCGAMTAIALRAQSKVARHFDPDYSADDHDPPDIAQSFVRALAACIEEGIPWSYSNSLEITSFPRGRLECGRTLKHLASRGVRHRVVVRVPTRRQDEELVRVARAAHRYLPATPGAILRRLVEAESLIGAFDDANSFDSLPRAIAAAERVTLRPELARTAAGVLAECSLTILRREYDAAGVMCPVPSGIARFRDLEELWERCVQRFVECTPEIVGTGAVNLHGLAGSGIRLFRDGGPLIDPDVAVSDDKKVTSIVDAKYKSQMGGRADASDLYQISAYARRIGASLGLLVYFGEPKGIAIIGTTPEEALIVAASISPDLLISDGENALAQLLLETTGVNNRIRDCLRNRTRQQGADRIPDLPSDILFRPDEYEVIGE